MIAYLDSSAIVKLVIRESESSALRRFLRAYAIRVSSELARVEVIRAVRLQDIEIRARALAVLSRIRLLRIDEDVISAAATMNPAVLRSLDAIHLASVQVFGSELNAIVTYDARMREAAGLIGFSTYAPE